MTSRNRRAGDPPSLAYMGSRTLQSLANALF